VPIWGEPLGLLSSVIIPIHNNKVSVSNHGAAVHLHFMMPFERSNLQGLGPFFHIELLKAGRAPGVVRRLLRGS